MIQICFLALLQEHRRLTCAELARIQGFQSGELAWKCCATPLTARGHQIGNSMSVPVLAEAMRAVLSAANLLWRLRIIAAQLIQVLKASSIYHFVLATPRCLLVKFQRELRVWHELHLDMVAYHVGRASGEAPKIHLQVSLNQAWQSSTIASFDENKTSLSMSHVNDRQPA